MSVNVFDQSRFVFEYLFRTLKLSMEESQRFAEKMKKFSTMRDKRK